MSPSPSPEKGGDSDLHKVLDHHGLRLGEDNFVEWNPDEKQHPRNWPLFKKTYNVFLVCFFEFWMTAISSSGVCDAIGLACPITDNVLLDCGIRNRARRVSSQQNGWISHVHILVSMVGKWAQQS